MWLGAEGRELGGWRSWRGEGGENESVNGDVVRWLAGKLEKIGGWVWGGGYPPIHSCMEGHPAAMLWGVPPPISYTSLPLKNQMLWGVPPPIHSPMIGAMWLAS